MKCRDVIVLGAGIAGLSTALALKRRGQDVLIIEKKERGGASAAAAGILDPLLEMEKNSPTLPLALEAFRFYPRFLKQIKREIDEDPGYEKTGMLLVATNKREEKALRERYRWHSKTGVPVRWLSAKQVEKKESALREKIEAGIYYPTVGRVRPKQLLKAIRKMAVRRGVRFQRLNREATIQSKDGVFRGLRIGKTVLAADHLVIATGSWSGLRSLHQKMLPVTPVRGQMVVMRGKMASRLILHSSEGYYSVPWGKNEFLLGSTVEHVGYRPEVTESGLQKIEKGVRKFVPGMSGFKRVKSWSGLRPYCKDGLPLVGEIRTQGIAVATGFFRSGILLSPLVGELLAEMILSGQENKLLAPFSPARFGF